MTDFKKYKLGDLCTNVTSGGTPLRSQSVFYEGGKIPWLKTKEVTNGRIYETENHITELGLAKSSAKLIPANSIIVAMYGDGETAGRVAINRIPLTTNQACCNLTINSAKANNEFIYYYLLNSYEYLVNLKSGSGQQNLSSAIIKNMEVEIPNDISTQGLIASILSSLDDKIELNRRTNQTLEQIAQTLFKKYFVDDINPENLPDGWRWGGFGEICENFDSKRIPLSSMERDKRKGIYPYYGAASLMGFVDNYIFEGLHILLGEDGSVIDERGFPILQYVWGKFWVNNHAHVLKGKSYFSTNHLYMILLNTSVAHLVTGAVQPKINQGNLNSLEVLIPDEKACSKFTKEIDSLFELKKSNIDETKNLEKIRDSLLPKLMSGEIEVNTIEKN